MWKDGHQNVDNDLMIVVKNLPVNEGDIRDTGSIPGLGRSPGGGNGNPLQYSCLGNSMDRGAWRAMVHKVAKSQIQLKWLSTAHITEIQFSSFQFSCSVMSDSFGPRGLQHARPPCPSPTPRVYPNSYPSSQWCHPTISSSVIPFSSRLQSFPASGSFQMSQFFLSGGRSIGVSALVLPRNIQDWFPLGWAGWICLQSKGLSRVFSNTTVQKHSIAQMYLYI